MMSHFAGFFISAIVHIAVLTFAINLLENPHPVTPKPKTVQLTLAMFEEKTPIVPIKKVIPKTLPKTKEIEKPKVLKQKPLTLPKALPKRTKPIINKKPHKKPPKKIIKKAKLKKIVKLKRKKAHTKPLKKRLRKPVKKFSKRAILRKQAMAPKPRPVRKVLTKPLHRPIVRHVVKRPLKGAVTYKVVHKPIQRAQRKPVLPHQARVKKSPVRKPPAKPASNNAQIARLKAAYKTRLRQLIAVNKRYPKRAKRRGKQGTVLVSFIVFANGVIKNIKIAKSSGYSILDNAALKTVDKVSGKLPFTKGINKTQWFFTLPVVYQLR